MIRGRNLGKRSIDFFLRRVRKFFYVRDGAPLIGIAFPGKEIPFFDSEKKLIFRFFRNDTLLNPIDFIF
ncbi:hypothetical protein DLM78_06570 [Leptospira stimsonii]|uniref:Uncharacterized protein n=1 Tax=Leptospira stimsonii TaxID=2202203 RepID=A0A8B3CXU5_9LEPT|nr:hypothetical protein DLM78_06570 [Leptospira stimsonii]